MKLISIELTDAEARLLADVAKNLERRIYDRNTDMYRDAYEGLWSKLRRALEAEEVVP